jgi:YidC/Oxa1 family membrane protein insertase
MEKRAILAFGLSMVLLVGYMWLQERYFAPPAKPPETQKAPEPATGPAPQRPPSPEAAKTLPAPAPVPGTAQPEPGREGPRPTEQRVTVASPLYSAVVSTDGGQLKQWTLHYRGDKPMVVLGEQGPGGLRVHPVEATAAEPVGMATQAGEIRVSVENREQPLVLTGEESGLRVRETLTFRADNYTIETVVRLENRGAVPRSVRVALPWHSRVQWGEVHERFIGQRPTEVVWSSAGHVDRIEDLSQLPGRQVDGEWIAMGSVWYLAAMIARSPGWRLAMDSEAAQKESADGRKSPSGRVTIALQATPTIAPGQAWEGRVDMYVGPKEYEYLRAVGLDPTINFGGFPLPRRWGGLPMDWLGVPILLVMKWVYRYVGNYGIAIILLTIVTKVLFYPLTVKSMRSMKAMQALQPQVNALRAKYKSDPQRAQREMMELYRKHHVNPMGGCLPMVAQIPIFYALYLALSVSVELQNAGFLCFGRIFGADLWICDLAGQDPTYVLPILMGVTMFVQQKMTPVTGDPRQAKMMLMMPVVFTFMFLNLPSGLVLYWTVSNILQILQQWFMDRPAARAVREAKDAGRA